MTLHEVFVTALVVVGALMVTQIFAAAILVFRALNREWKNMEKGNSGGRL